MIADALEMKAVSATVGVEAAAVRALDAGVDALCVGHDLGEDDVARIERARRGGRRRRARRRSGSSRRQAASRRSPRGRSPSPTAVDAAVGAGAARRALVVEGDVALAGGAAIVELRPRANIAAGEAEHRARRAPSRPRG